MADAPFREILLANGYKHFTSPHNQKDGYQKCIYEGRDKKYYNTIWEYSYADFQAAGNYPKEWPTFSYELDNSFHQSETLPVIWFRLAVGTADQENLTRVEQTAEMLWEAYGKPYYEKYQ